MKFLMIIPPCGKKTTSFPPYGALYIGTILESHGYDTKLLNLDLLRYDNKTTVETIRQFNPDVIGISGIVSTTYGHIKKISKTIRVAFPNTIQILGGQLSNAEKTILAHTEINIVVKGEAEKTILALMKALKKKENLTNIPGIAFLKDGRPFITPKVKLIENLDELPLPNFGLIDMKHYLFDPFKRFALFLPYISKIDARFTQSHRRGQKAFTIMTGRGCHAACTFCSRNIPGLRKHSVEYILDLIELLKNKYNVGYFTFGDESFVSSKAWVLKFLFELKKRKLDILFYILGARVDTVDPELLTKLKDSGCFMIEYGFESGSQRMLDMMQKKTTVAQNLQVYKWTIQAGLHTVPAVLINMPGENNTTISKTIAFLKKLNLPDNSQYFINYAQAHPGTPLYQYALQNQMIKNEDQYLMNLTEAIPGRYEDCVKKGVLFNFSNMPIKVVASWSERIRLEVGIDIIRKKNRILFPINFIFFWFFPKLKNQLHNLFQNRRIETISRTMIRFGHIGHGLFEKIKSKEHLNKENLHSINQLNLKNEGLITRIKKKEYDFRKKKDYPFIGNMEFYEDTIGGKKIVRYPSLRKLLIKKGA